MNHCSHDQHTQQDQRGFSLVESLIAMGVVTVGVLGMAEVFTLGINNLMVSGDALIAREKARSTIEIIHSARDARIITWDQMRNVNPPSSGCTGSSTTSGGGVFLNGNQNLYQAGPDGLVNTSAANSAAVWETSPGPDGRLGTTDDAPLANYQRDIRFCDLGIGLREVTVTIQYKVAGRTLTYSLKSLISQYS